jgi:hypothetical protein
LKSLVHFFENFSKSLVVGEIDAQSLGSTFERTKKKEKNWTLWCATTLFHALAVQRYKPVVARPAAVVESSFYVSNIAAVFSHLGFSMFTNKTNHTFSSTASDTMMLFRHKMDHPSARYVFLLKNPTSS